MLVPFFFLSWKKASLKHEAKRRRKRETIEPFIWCLWAPVSQHIWREFCSQTSGSQHAVPTPGWLVENWITIFILDLLNHKLRSGIQQFYFNKFYREFLWVLRFRDTAQIFQIYEGIHALFLSLSVENSTNTATGINRVGWVVIASQYYRPKENWKYFFSSTKIYGYVISWGKFSAVHIYVNRDGTWWEFSRKLSQISKIKEWNLS